MDEIKLDLNSPKTIIDSLDKSQKALENGDIIVFPTDTIYGLGANALNDKAILKIFKVKKRDISKPISILVRDIKMAKKVACIDSRAEKILEKIWPDSITVILRKKDIIPYTLTAGKENVAVRVSNNFFVNELLKRIDFPLTATSANISGKENLFFERDIKNEFSDIDNAPDLFINNGDLQNRLPSTIIDLTDINRPKIVRMGMVGKDKLDAFFKKFID